MPAKPKTLVQRSDCYWLIKASNSLFKHQINARDEILTKLDQLELMAITFEAATRYPKLGSSTNLIHLMGKLNGKQVKAIDIKGLRNRFIAILEREHKTVGFSEKGWKSKSLKPGEAKSLYKKLVAVGPQFNLTASLHEFDSFSVVEVTGNPKFTPSMFKAALETIQQL